MNMTSKKKSFNRNSIVYMIRMAMSVIFPLVTFKFASKAILANGIGEANFSAAIIGYVSLISSLGISSYAISEGSKIRNEREKFCKFASEVFTINMVSMVLSYVCLALLLIIFRGLDQYRIPILIYSSTIFFTAIGVEWLLIIDEQFTFITVRSIIFQIFALIMCFVFVKDEDDVAWYVALTAVSTAGSGILNYFYIKKRFPIKMLVVKEIKMHIKPILIIWAANVASLIYLNADIIIIGILRGDVDNGYYSAAVKVIKAICLPISAISVVAGPQLAEEIHKYNYENINKIIKKVIDFMSFFMFPCIILLFLLGRESVLLISGEEFLPGLAAERILLFDIILSPLNGFIVNQIMIPLKKEKQSMNAMIIAAITNIVLDIAFIKMYGIYGAAIATIISELVVLLFCIPHVLKIIKYKYIIKDLWKFIVSSLIIFPIYFGCKLVFINPYYLVIMVLVASSIGYCLFVSLLTHKNPFSLLKQHK